MVKKLLLLAAALSLALAVALGTGCSESNDSGEAADSGDEWDVFTSTEHGFTMSYPPDWTKQEDASGAVVAFVSRPSTAFPAPCALC